MIAGGGHQFGRIDGMLVIDIGNVSGIGRGHTLILHGEKNNAALESARIEKGPEGPCWTSGLHGAHRRVQSFFLFFGNSHLADL
jgi:hypothetical protein